MSGSEKLLVADEDDSASSTVNFELDFPELKEIDNGVGENPIGYADRDAVELLRLEKKYMALLERYNKLLNILVRLANTNELQTLRKEILLFLEKNAN